MIPVLYEPTATNFSTYGIGALPDAISPHVVEERNGEYTLEMQYPIDGMNYEHIGMRSIITAKPSPDKTPQPFRVVRISKPINGIVTIYARHIRYDLEGVPVAPFTANNISEALQAIKSNMMTENPFNFFTDKTTNVRMKSDVPTSALSLMGGQEGSLLDIYGGEYDYNGFNVTLKANRGENTDVVIRYGVNLVDLEQEENCSNVYTGVLAFWKSFDTDDRVVGDIQSVGTFDYSRIKVIDRSDSYETEPTKAQLNADAVSYINANKIGVPRVSINLKFQQAEELEIEGNELHLCDYVTVVFEKLGVSAKAKIIRTDYDVINERYISLDIGDARSSMADTIIGIGAMAESAPTTREMRQVINATTAAIIGAKGGAVRLLDTDDDGVPDTLYIADNQDPLLAEKVWRFNFEGWGASQNGYNGPYTMGATFAAGMLADFITAGTLDASLINVTNLDAGSITTGTLNADNINVTNINGANIKNGTIGSNPLASSAVTSAKLASSSVTTAKINSGAVTSAKLGESSVVSDKIGTDAVINRCISSGAVYPTTCNSTINGYFADVIEFNALRAGALVVDYLQAGVVSWDRFRLANGGTQYTMYRDQNTGALYAHT